MMRRIFTGLLCLFAFTAQTQGLRDTNFNYRYDPDAPFHFSWKIIKAGNTYKVAYEVLPNDTTQVFTDLAIQLEARISTIEKNGLSVHNKLLNQKGANLGIAEFPIQQDQQIIVAKISWSRSGKPGINMFYKSLPKAESLYLSTAEKILTTTFTNKEKTITIEGIDTTKQLQLAYYSMSFPPAAPAFSMAQAKVAKAIKPDSTHTLKASSPITLIKKGLYLAQHDTSSAEGVAFRVEADYPKLTKLESLSGPLIYICTKQENEKLKLAGNDKKKFDQIVLSITGNQERARIFMRNYFRRVELANLYFSSYKEGWKTDRGMIYIIFGVPEEAYFFESREVWEYKIDSSKIRFQFIKSPTLFDPDNYVLIRDKKFTNPWLERVDLIRKARF